MADTYQLVETEEAPLELAPDTLYLEGENGNYWDLRFLCPCGCGKQIALNLIPLQNGPRWSFTREADGTFTVSPSVNRIVGCRSHFWLRNSRIVWC